MRTFFNPDNFLWRWFGKLADYVFLSCLWILCSLPVVTMGAATIALYDATAHCIRGPEGGTYRRFFRTFKRELGRGILMTLFWAMIFVVLIFNYQILYQAAEGSTLWTVVSLVYLCMMFVPVGTAAWAFALESRFVYSFGALHKNAFIITFAHLPYTFAMVVLFVAALIACLFFLPLGMVLPGLLAYLQSFFAEKVMKKYMPPEEEEE